MGAYHAKRNLKLFERMLNNPLGLLLALYVIALAIYVSLFYVFMTSSPLNSLQSTAESDESAVTVIPNPRFEVQTAADSMQVKLPDRDDSTSSGRTDDEKKSRRVSQSVTVNGQSVPVPTNGSSHTVIRSTGEDNGDVDVSITSRSTGESDVSSSLEVNVEASTSSVKEVER